MSGFQRMIAIPQEEYIQLSSVQRMSQPEAQKMVALSNEYQQQASIPDPHKQMILQGSTLEEMKNLKEKIRQDISLGTPKPYRNRALSLFRSLEPTIKFNERGEMYGDDDKPIDYSRAEDLIQHAVRDRRRPFTPTGWGEFLSLLRKHNIPKAMLNRATLDELEMKPKTDKVSRKRKMVEPPFPLTKMERKRRPSSRYPSTEFLKDF